MLGYKYVHEAINDELCNKFINEYLDYESIFTIENEGDLILLIIKKRDLKDLEINF